VRRPINNDEICEISRWYALKVKESFTKDVCTKLEIQVVRRMAEYTLPPFRLAAIRAFTGRKRHQGRIQLLTGHSRHCMIHIGKGQSRRGCVVRAGSDEGCFGCFWIIKVNDQMNPAYADSYSETAIDLLGLPMPGLRRHRAIVPVVLRKVRDDVVSGQCVWLSHSVSDECISRQESRLRLCQKTWSVVIPCHLNWTSSKQWRSTG
jgi:hypothetical protein